MRSKTKFSFLILILVLSILPTVIVFATLKPSESIYIQHLLNGDASVRVDITRDQFTILEGLGFLNYSLSFVMLVAASWIIFSVCLVLLALERAKRSRRKGELSK